MGRYLEVVTAAWLAACGPPPSPPRLIAEPPPPKVGTPTRKPVLSVLAPEIVVQGRFNDGPRLVFVMTVPSYAAIEPPLDKARIAALAALEQARTSKRDVAKAAKAADVARDRALARRPATDAEYLLQMLLLYDKEEQQWDDAVEAAIAKNQPEPSATFTKTIAAAEAILKRGPDELAQLVREDIRIRVAKLDDDRDEGLVALASLGRVAKPEVARRAWSIVARETYGDARKEMRALAVESHRWLATHEKNADYVADLSFRLGVLLERDDPSAAAAAFCASNLNLKAEAEARLPIAVARTDAAFVAEACKANRCPCTEETLGAAATLLIEEDERTRAKALLELLAGKFPNAKLPATTTIARADDDAETARRHLAAMPSLRHCYEASRMESRAMTMEVVVGDSGGTIEAKAISTPFDALTTACLVAALQRHAWTGLDHRRIVIPLDFRGP